MHNGDLETKDENYWIDLASRQLDAKDYSAAYDSTEQACKINPQSAEALAFKANAEMKLLKYDAAFQTILGALAVDANHDLALWIAAYLCYRENKIDVAKEYADRAIKVNPGLRMMRAILGDYERIHNGNCAKAIELYNEELQLDPNSMRAFYCLGITFSDLGMIEQGVEYLKKHLTIIPKDKDVYSRLLTLNLYTPGIKPQQILDEANKYYEVCYPEFATNPNQQVDFSHLDLDPDKKTLRVAFISADFRGHVTLSWIEGLFEKLRNKNFEIYCFSNAEEDEDTSIWQRGVNGWIKIRELTDKQAAESIRESKIDILIDITGHLAGQRLGVMAYKPCPLQASWLGQSGPFGFPQIDYMITDKLFVKDAFEEQFYNEKIYRMPNYFAAKPPRPYNVELRPAPVNQNGYITFGSFNTFIKINSQVLQTWAEILRQVPNSRLLLKSSLLRDASHIDYVKSFFPDAADRLILETGSDLLAYLNSYNRVDIALDPFPVCGGTTSHDALFMSTPYITLCGEHAAHRAGVIAQYLGCAELISYSQDEYIRKVVALANDKSRINYYKSSLRDKYKSSILCDTENFVDDFANALRDMWQQTVSKCKLNNNEISSTR